MAHIVVSAHILRCVLRGFQLKEYSDNITPLVMIGHNSVM